jgi:fatty acid desaturase
MSASPSRISAVSTPTSEPITACRVPAAQTLREIPTPLRQKLRTLQRKDNWRNVGYLAFDWGIVAVAIAASLASSFHPLVYVTAVVVIGSRQRALRGLVHEASHRKLMRNRLLNDWLGRLFAAFPLVTSLSGYMCAHCRHHACLWDSERDPKRPFYAKWGLTRGAARPAAFRRDHIARPLLFLHSPAFVFLGLRYFFSRQEPSEVIMRYLFAGGAIALIFVLNLGAAFVLFWCVPFCTTYQLFRYWSDMADHGGLESDDPWRTTRNWDATRLVRWALAPHDDRFHLTHHIVPGIPHFRVAEAHRLLMAVPQYAAGHHCDGFFFARRTDAPSVIQDMRWPNLVDVIRLEGTATNASPQPKAPMGPA